MFKESLDQAAIDSLKKLTETKPEYSEVVVGNVFEYCEGGKYRILNAHRSTNRYEETGETSFSVEYEQLYTGRFPEGTIWTKDIDYFVGYTERGGLQVKIFTLVKAP